MERVPSDNPFNPLNLAFWTRRNYFSSGIVEYSTKPGEWGYCQFSLSCQSYPSGWLEELSTDWLSRRYDPKLDPAPSTELRLKAVGKFKSIMQEDPERLDDVDVQTKEMYIAAFHEITPPQGTSVN